MATLRSRLSAAYLASGLILLVAVSAALAVVRTRTLRTEGRHNREVLNLLHDFERRLADAEREQDAYLLSGDRRHLPDFETAQHDAEARLDDLQRLTAENAREQEACLRLRALLSKSETELSAELDQRERAGALVPRPQPEGGPAEPGPTARLRALADELDAIEERTLDARRGQVDYSVLMTLWIAVGGSIFAFATAVIVNRGLSREVAAREEARVLIERQAAELRDTLEAAERATHAREDLLAIVSHDLRNPLAAVSVAEGVMRRGLERQPPDAAMLARGLETIKRSVKRMGRLVSDLLDAASIEAGRFSVKAAPTPAAGLLRETLATHELRAQVRGCSLLLGEVDEGVQALADRERVLQLLGNLLDNAIKFTPAGGAITLGLGGAQGSAILSVADTGPGIPAEQLPHVFDRYWKGVRKSPDGAGLGLYICRGIARAHGGELTVVSRVGQGTTFTLRLPVAEGAPTA